MPGRQDNPPASPVPEQPPASQALRAALRANAAFSASCGLALLAGGPRRAPRWGVRPPLVLPVLGGGLLAFAAGVGTTAALPAVQLRRQARHVVLADTAWVLTAAALAAAGPLSRAGVVALGGVSVGVAALGARQGWALRRLPAQPGPQEDLELVVARRRLAAPPERVWALITDHELYGRLAPNLSRVEVTSDPGQTLTRRCHDTRGRTWNEACTLWDPGREYAVEVDTGDYPYPLTVVRGAWGVRPAPDGTSDVVMRLAYQARPGLRGAAFTALLALGARPLAQHVLCQWQQRAETTHSAPVGSPGGSERPAGGTHRSAVAEPS